MKNDNILILLLDTQRINHRQFSRQAVHKGPRSLICFRAPFPALPRLTANLNSAQHRDKDKGKNGHGNQELKQRESSLAGWFLVLSGECRGLNSGLEMFCAEHATLKIRCD